MITSPAFRGKTLCGARPGRSGLATVEALVASGAEVTAWDKREEAEAAALFPGEGRGPDTDSEYWTPAFAGECAHSRRPARDRPRRLRRRRRLPRRPAQHPPDRPPRRARRRAADRRHRAVRAGARFPAAAQGGRHHRHQRQVDDHRARPPHPARPPACRATMGGNIGLPILAQDPLPEGGVYVLELSSYQIDLTYSLDCDVAVLLNVTPDHLDRYDGLRRLCGLEGAAVRDAVRDHAAVIIRRSHDVATTRYRDRWSTIHDTDLPGPGRGARRPEHWPTLQGPHNAQNAPAAAGCRVAWRSAESVIAEGLRTYPGLPHRMERIAERERHPLRQRQQGDQPGFHRAGARRLTRISTGLSAAAPRATISGRARPISAMSAPPTRSARPGRCSRACSRARCPVTQCEMLMKAVERAADAATPGEVVLLSPACASFDQFRDYEARGDAFRAAVEACHERQREDEAAAASRRRKAPRLGRSDTKRDRPLVLGDRQGPADPGRGADLDRPDRGRRRLARRRPAPFGRADRASRRFIISTASWSGSCVAVPVMIGVSMLPKATARRLSLLGAVLFTGLARSWSRSSARR